MYLISTQLSKNKKYRDCVVFKVTYINDYEPLNVTEDTAVMYGLGFKHGRIRIYSGSGTGFMVLRQLLQGGITTQIVFDLSVF